MKIAIAQMNPIIGDFPHNFNRIMHFCDQAKARACRLIVFSELAIPGYPSRDLLEKNDFINANLACLNKLVDTIRGIGVICGYVDRSPAQEGNPLFNSAALFEDGVVLHKVNKRLLPTYDIFDEGRYFEPGTACDAYPYRGRRIGLTICEDVWNDKDIFKRRIYHSDPVGHMIRQGADLIVNISASPFYVGKREFREHMLGSIARKYGVSLIYANQVGGNDSVLFDGISCAFDPGGNLIARAQDFSEDLVEFDMDANSGERHAIAASETESIFRALVMGTRDYVAKCGFSKVVVGLSGGIDSALTACIAVQALGRQNVLTVFMPSRYTSEDNFEDTQTLARNLGVQMLKIPIDSMLTEFVRFLSPSFREDSPGIVEQNLQARIRGTILMALSNKYGSLLLSTGNKSELAVGYCTLYGDMSGGLAVISDVPKTVVYKLAHYYNRDQEYIPQRIIRKAPSAELKPDQTDQDDLPPYEQLDPILKSYIEDLKGADELVQMGFDKKLVKEIILKVDRNEYKRHQAAPGLKVTSKAFGYGRRYPIAQRFKPDLK